MKNTTYMTTRFNLQFVTPCRVTNAAIKSWGGGGVGSPRGKERIWKK